MNFINKIKMMMAGFCSYLTPWEPHEANKLLIFPNLSSLGGCTGRHKACGKHCEIYPEKLREQPSGLMGHSGSGISLFAYDCVRCLVGSGSL
jgi:hypothetical protein